MSYIDKINAILDEIDPGNATFKILITDNYVRVEDSHWTIPTPTEEDFYNSRVHYCVSRSLNKETLKYEIDKDSTVSKIENDVYNDIVNIFQKCSPTKEPRRTKIYKSFVEVVRQNKSTIKFSSALFDISEYYYNSAKTDSIKNSINDVHRKNIYQLLCLMEKNYAKRKTNSY